MQNVDQLEEIIHVTIRNEMNVSRGGKCRVKQNFKASNEQSKEEK